MSVGDVVADYVTEAAEREGTDVAQVLAAALVALHLRGEADSIRALGPWQWDGSARVVRERIGFDACDDVEVFRELSEQPRWRIRFRAKPVEAGAYALPETATAAADAMLRHRHWTLAPGGLPPRPER